MTITRVTARWNKLSGIVADGSVNVWHFQHLDALNDAKSLRVAQGVADFYSRISSYYSGTLSRGVGAAMTLQTATVTPGAPGSGDDTVSKIYDEFIEPAAVVFPAMTASMTNYPTEVAAVMSFRGDITGLVEELGATRPAARRRGRLFLGPLNTSAGTALTTVEARPTASFRDAVLDSYAMMLTYLTTEPDIFQHGVYSPSNGDLAVVVEASMDDAFDTVRSRGVLKTLRESRPQDWTV